MKTCAAKQDQRGRKMKWLKWLLRHLHLRRSKPKVAYICGPLTDLPLEVQIETKILYELLGSVCEYELGFRGFVPHEHTDPIKHAHFTAQEVYKRDFEQVSKRTSVLIIVAVAPSWGGGMEVAWAQSANVPIIVMIPAGKKTSRLLRGGPGILNILEYKGTTDACRLLADALRYMRYNLN